jgi:hypothetical protein
MTAADGFIPEPTHYRLTFTDERLTGLSVTVHSVSVRRRITFNKTRFTLPTTEAEADRYIQDIYSEFCDRLVEWNLLDEDGNPAPLNLDGLLDQHDYIVDAMLKAWFTEVVDAAAVVRENPTAPDFDPSEIPMQTGVEPTGT